MPIVRYGNWGHPLLILPTAAADYLENERFFLIKVLEPFIFSGRIQVFSVDSINKHAWMNDKLPVPEMVRRQKLYAGYIEEELVPHIRRVVQNPSARIGITGASFGAFHAANQFFRRPDMFDALIAMSGFMDISAYLEGYFNEDAYFNNPMMYVSNLEDQNTLNVLRNDCQIHIVTGQGSYEKPEASKRFSDMLWRKGIPNNLDLWGYDMPHDWPTWRLMLPYYVEHKLGW